MLRYFIIHKPYRVLSQFSPETGKLTLKDFFPVPSDVYPVGRLDYDSEGLLILTNDRSLNHRLLHPQFAHEREYYVQVEGTPVSTALEQWRQGVTITVNGKAFHTGPAGAALLPAAAVLSIPEREPPIRYRKAIPATWVSLVLQEGKNRQVRKMTAAAGYPTLRLIRYRIEDITLEGLQPGEMREMKKEVLETALFKRSSGTPALHPFKRKSRK